MYTGFIGRDCAQKYYFFILVAKHSIKLIRSPCKRYAEKKQACFIHFFIKVQHRIIIELNWGNLVEL